MTNDFNFPSENKSNNQKENEKNLASGGSSEEQLLLDPPLTEEEISADLSAIINEAADLDDLDMMIQSASPFQHPRSVAQNYVAHTNPNSYHRQAPYHHHHQVCKYFSTNNKTNWIFHEINQFQCNFVSIG